MVPIAAALLVALHFHETPFQRGGLDGHRRLVSLVPEGLVLLASVAFAVGAGRMARRGALVQRLYAVESLAGRRRGLRRQDRHAHRRHARARRDRAARRHSEAEVRAELGAFATSLAGRNPTADAIAEALGGVAPRRAGRGAVLVALEVERAHAEHGETQVLGAPDVLAAAGRDAASIGALVDVRAREQRRVLLFARATGALAEPRRRASRSCRRSSRSGSSR